MKERNYGVDLAKALAMFLVVLVHLCTNGGALPTSGTGFCIGAYVKSLAWCCVDLFALVSGYIGVTGHPTFAKWGRLWLQVFVTGALMTLVSRFAFGVPMTGAHWTHLILPVTTSGYWYFTAYTGLYCLMPVLNLGLRALTRRQALGVTAGLLAVALSASVGARDVFCLGLGYSVAWLTVLYVLGGVIRLHVPQLPRVRWCLVAAFLLPALTAAQQILLARFPSLEAKLGVRALAGEYISPVVLLTAVALLMACLQVRVVSARVKAVAVFYSSTAFGVYLLHVHSMFFYGFLRDRFRPLGEYGNVHAWQWSLAIVALAFAAHLLFALVEKARKSVFRV